MHTIRRKTAAAALSAALLFGAAPAASAAETMSAPTDAGFTVIEVTAAQIGSQGAYEALNAALLTARDNATDANPYKIVVEPGDYVLKEEETNPDSENSVDDNVPYIYSNTWLVLNGVTLRRAIPYNMLCIAYKDKDGNKIAGYGTRNVIIDGGTFESEACESVTTIKLGHARNVMLRNVTIKNTYNAHMMEIAAVDGLTMTGCTFDTQNLDAGKAGEEAIQLDVCQKNHMNHYLNEDLPLQNVTIEQCAFRNCPTGVGSHTSIFNAPHRNMVIRDNTFDDMSVSAVKTLGWTDSRIERNTIRNAACGIMVRELDKEGEGTYRSGVVAEEGGTEAHYSEEYQAPKSQLKVDSNIITAGAVANPYSPSAAQRAIAVLGARVVSSKVYGRGGGLPKGDYLCDGVQVTNNLIAVSGDGVHVEYSQNINVENNVIHHTGDSTGQQTDCGVTLCNSVLSANVRKNYITDPPDSGVRVGAGCAAKDINDNEIYAPGYYGIGLDGAKITTLSNNEVRSAATGIKLTNGAAVSYRIKGNRVINSTFGLEVSADSSVAMAEENLFFRCGWAISFIGSGKYGNNFFSSQALTGVTPKPLSVTLTVGSAARLSKTPVPLQTDAVYSYASSNPAVASVDAVTGRITAVSAGVTAVTVTDGSGVQASVPVTVTEQPLSQVLGDVDNDGYVTSLDNALIAGYVSRTSGYETVNTAQADVNNDGEINAKDRIILARRIERLDGYTALPADVFGEADDRGELVLGSAQGERGQTADVVVTLAHNPGVATAELELVFDSSVLTLESVTDGGVLTGASAEHSDKRGSPYHLSWVNDLAAQNSTAEGALVTLRFKIAADAPLGSYPIRCNTAATEVYDKDLRTVPVTVSEGAVEVVRGDGVPAGDANADGVVTIEDVTHIQRHIAELLTVRDFAAADVNGDGVLTIEDATVIQRYLAELLPALPYGAAFSSYSGQA